MNSVSRGAGRAYLRLAFVVVFGLLSVATAKAQPQLFNFSECLFGDPPTLYLWVMSVDTSSGVAELNGVETQPTTVAFTWEWGDGSAQDGYFPQSHTFANRSRNYVVSVISHYLGGRADTAQTLVRFVPASYDPELLPDGVPVTIPQVMPALATRLYPIGSNLSPFDNSVFSSISRGSLESILTRIAGIEMDFTNDNVFLFENQFAQVMLRDSTFGGAYSIWFSDPVAFGVGDAFLQGSIGYSSLFHEMGHNFTLNTPADFYYGGRIDGPANAIYSETMAQIYQHAAGWMLLNSTTLYDVDEDMAFEIKGSVNSSMAVVRDWYESYLALGMPFNSWNDPPDESVLATFMTLAYKFCEHAETSGMGYRAPLKRMTTMLQRFDQDLADAFDQNHNTMDADSARATLMVAAMSHGFFLDLRDEFRTLHFPIEDSLYDALMDEVGMVNTVPILQRLIADVDLSVYDEYELNLEDPAVFIDWDGEPLLYTAVCVPDGIVTAWVDVTTLHVIADAPGIAKVVVTAADPQGGQEATAFKISVTDPNACGCDCHCDPRCDSVTNIFDVTIAINRAFRGSDPFPDPSVNCPLETVDVNCDGVPNVFDVTHLINVAFRGGDPAVEFCDPCP